MSKQKAAHLIRLAQEMKKQGAITNWEYQKILNKLSKIGGK